MKKMALVALALVALMACGGPTDEQKAMIGKTLTVQQGSFEIRVTISVSDSESANRLYFTEAIVFYPSHWQDVRAQQIGNWYIYTITAKVGDGLRSETVKLYSLSAPGDPSKGPMLWSLQPAQDNLVVEWRKKEAR